MTFPSFTTGEVLTAADMNAVGLWRVATGSFTNAASFDVTGFTSTYSFFQLNMQIQRHTGTGTVTMTGQFFAGASAITQYYGAGFFASYLGTSGVTQERNNGSNLGLGQVNSQNPARFSCWVSGMNAGVIKNIMGNYYDYANSRYITFGYESSNTANSADMLRVSATVNVTGNWRLYGYKEP